MNSIPHPEIVTPAEWLVKRKELLAHEKELTKQYDLVNAMRRRLPMVKLDKEYSFAGTNGTVKLMLPLKPGMDP